MGKRWVPKVEATHGHHLQVRCCHRGVLQHGKVQLVQLLHALQLLHLLPSEHEVVQLHWGQLWSCVQPVSSCHVNMFRLRPDRCSSRARLSLCCPLRHWPAALLINAVPALPPLLLIQAMAPGEARGHMRSHTKLPLPWVMQDMLSPLARNWCVIDGPEGTGATGGGSWGTRFGGAVWPRPFPAQAVRGGLCLSLP